MMKQLLTTKEVANLCSVTIMTVRNWARMNKLCPIKNVISKLPLSEIGRCAIFGFG